MAAEPLHTHSDDQTCSCGLSSVVKVQDRPMCGHCFHLGMTVAQSRRIHSWEDSYQTEEPDSDLDEILRAAVTQFDELRQQIDSLLESLDGRGKGR